MNEFLYCGQVSTDQIKEAANEQCPKGYPMVIKSQKTWNAIIAAVNQGIDSYLEAFTRSEFNDNGECFVHPDELHILVRRLSESNDEEAEDLGLCILATLEIEVV